MIQQNDEAEASERAKTEAEAQAASIKAAEEAKTVEEAELDAIAKKA